MNTPLDNVLTVSQPIFAHASKWRFIDASEVVTSLRDKNLPTYIIIKVTEPIIPESATVTLPPIKLPLCQLFYVYSAKLLFAYLFEIPSYKITLRANHVAVVRPVASKISKFKDVDMMLQNAHLSVFHSADGGSLITFNNRFENLNSEILRGGNV